MHLRSALARHRILFQVEIDTVVALMMGSDIGHGAIDIAYLDRRGRQADDAAGSDSLRVLADISIVAASIDTVDDEIAPVTILVGKAGRDHPADDRLVLRRIEQGMVLGVGDECLLPEVPGSASG